MKNFGIDARFVIDTDDKSVSSKLSDIQESLTTVSSNLAGKAKEHWVDVSKFGYNLQAVKDAVATLTDGDVLYFPNAIAPYQILGEPITLSVPNITLCGEGLLQMEYGFRPTESGFTADGLRMEATRYHSDSRAVFVAEPTDGKFINNFNVRNCQFKNFFYAADFRGGSYTVTGNETAEGYPVRDVTVENCRSETYTNQATGHFNCTQVENVSYINNKTYGGTTATSYNAIKGNGFLKMIGNYDDNNAYGSCEVENISGKVIIEGNTFKKAIWVDDSNTVVIDGNYTDDYIKVTCGSNNYVASNILITNNIAKQIRVESYGAYYGGYADNFKISDNICNGSGSYGIYIDGKYASFGIVDNNMVTGTYSSGKMGIVRGNAWATGTSYDVLTFNPDGSVLKQGSIVNNGGNTYLCVGVGTSGATAPTHTSGTASDGVCSWLYIKKTLEILLRQNIVNGTVVVSGSGGKVYKDDNFGTTWNGSTDTLTYS